jgi:uncharacterized membrane protein YsdA (DUF1294 family)/cold shock CspA family protein
MRYQGKIVEWNDARGFGFIVPVDGGERVFLHISALPRGSRRPTLDEFINYTQGTDDRGRARATQANYVVVRSGRRVDYPASRSGQLVSLFVAVAFLTFVSVAIVIGTLPSFVGAIYILMSIAAYVTYALDKQAARTADWRIEEAMLLLLGLAGGWPGALVAQHYLRHKNRKASFQFKYWLTVAINCAALIWFRRS